MNGQKEWRTALEAGLFWLRQDKKIHNYKKKKKTCFYFSFFFTEKKKLFIQKITHIPENWDWSQ